MTFVEFAGYPRRFGELLAAPLAIAQPFGEFYLTAFAIHLKPILFKLKYLPAANPGPALLVRMTLSQNDDGELRGRMELHLSFDNESRYADQSLAEA